jgi:hypothetical protein
MPPRLLDQVRDRLRVKHYSMCTEDAYLQWFRRLIFFHRKKHPRGQSPVQLGDAPACDGSAVSLCAPQAAGYRRAGY